MIKEEFIQQTPFLYHLTDRRNLPSIKKWGRLYSTVDLVGKSGIQNANEYLHSQRPQHTSLIINGYEVFVRDQKPLNRALDKCLTDNWTREDYIYHLNKRVFTWPTINRLVKHYNRYENENPLILKFATEEILALNSNVEITRLNSGATRPLGVLGGVAPPRGKDTFKPFEEYDLSIKSVAEVTFLSSCLLPATFDIGSTPSSVWEKISLK